uniref:Reverse transcriptase domain-containing protein n=1 Tax=Tanacetum cinerariifolium TaxID=118510 RepID=A0A6L2N6V5_TANCI|nr:hypothetical protein [Tanacetum cinerariifolium]
METGGRKKSVAEPAPPARDPRDVETIERLQQRIQELELQQLRTDSSIEEAKTKPKVWDDEPVDVNPFGRETPRYVNRLYQPRHNDHVIDRDDIYRDDSIRSLGLKIEIPEFSGKVRPNDFIDCLSTVEGVFDVRDITNKLKVKLVAIKLRQHAWLWWDHVNKRRQIRGKSKNMNVEEVINEFDKLRMRCDVVEEEKQVIAQFLGVFGPEIADIVSLQPYCTNTDIFRLALKVEKHTKAKNKGSTSRFTPPTRTASPIATKTAPKATTPTTSAAGLIYDIDAEPELHEPSDELEYLDRGEALVIQRVLNMAISKSVDDNSWLRNNIFRTKCTSMRKICDIIIDAGKLRECSFYEVILMYAAHILLGRPWQFDRKTKHDGVQNTYSFKKDGLNITLVPFDSHPWQFDRKTKHDGVQNTYSFKKDGLNITLVPFDSHPWQFDTKTKHISISQ